jgi:hypothetical protein
MVPGEPPGESSPEEVGAFFGGVGIADSQQFYSRGMSRMFNSARSDFYSGRQR